VGIDGEGELDVLGVAEVPIVINKHPTPGLCETTALFYIVRDCTDPIVLGQAGLAPHMRRAAVHGSDHEWWPVNGPTSSPPQELNSPAAMKAEVDAPPTVEAATTGTSTDPDDSAPLVLWEAVVLPPGGSATVGVTYWTGLDERALKQKEDICIIPEPLFNKDRHLIPVTFSSYIKSPSTTKQAHHYLTLRNTSHKVVSLQVGQRLGVASCERITAPPPESTPVKLARRILANIVDAHAPLLSRRRIRRLRKEGKRVEANPEYRHDRREPTYTKAEHKIVMMVRQVRAILAAEPGQPPEEAKPADDEFLAGLDVNKDLTADQVNELRKVLIRNRVVFSKLNIGDPAPRATGVEFTINTGNAQPLKQAPYRHPPAKRAIINEEVANLLRNGLIEPSFSPWGSPVLLVQKKDGSQRMCIDYRKLNALTKKDAYPLPLIEDCLERLKDAKYMTVIDLADAYHHIPMNPESEAATAFVTQDGLYQWKVMPFGATGCPGAFQRYVDQVLHGLIGDICTAYFDDIVIYTNGTFEEHLLDLERVLQRLRDHHLRAKLKKCHFGYESVLFVGHVVHNGTIKPDPTKVEAVQKAPTPRDVTALKSFLGLANYYRKFIDGFAKTALPLYKLTKKNEPWVWTGAQEAAFNDLKRGLLNAKCLFAPDFRRPFILQTDASNIGLGAVLTQAFPDGEHPVAFISRQLKPPEANYSTTELEALAVVWAIKTFEHYLVDRHFIVVTDHHALQWLPTKKSLNKRLSRWAVYLSEFDFSVEYRKGVDNANADALSRNPLPPDPDGDTDMVDVPDAPPIRSTPRQHSSLVRAICIRAARSGQPISANVQGADAASAGTKEKVDEKDSEEPGQAAGPQDDVMDDSSDEKKESEAAATPAKGSAEVGDEPVSENGVADFDAGDYLLVGHKEFQAFVEAQRADPKLRDIIQALEKHLVPQNLSTQQRAIFLRRVAEHAIDPDTRALYCLRQSRDGFQHSKFMAFHRRLVVPEKYKQQIMTVYHDSPFAGHAGISRTYRRIVTRYDWDGMYQDVESYVNACRICIAAKAARKARIRQHPRMELPSAPFQIIAMDYIGPLLRSQDFTYVLVIVDMFTGWAITCPTTNQEATTTAKVLMDFVVCQHGVPDRILSDNAFDSQLLRDLTRTIGSHKIHSSPHHPQTNGMVERLNGTLKTIMRTTAQEWGTNWSLHLAPTTFAYNTAPKERDGLSPFFALYGRHPNVPGEFLGSVNEFDPSDTNTHEYVRELVARLRDVHGYMETQMKHIREQQLKKLEPRGPTPTFNVGDEVYLKTHRDQGPKAGLFAQRYDGPYWVTRKIGAVNYDIAARTPVTRALKQPFLVHVDDLKRVGQEADHHPAKPSHLPKLVPANEVIPAGFAMHTKRKKKKAPRIPQPEATPAPTSPAPTPEPTSSPAASSSNAADKPRRTHPNRHERRAHQVTEISDELRQQQHTDAPLPIIAPTPKIPEPSQHPMRTRIRAPVNYSEAAQEQQAVLNVYTDKSLPARPSPSIR
jgi:transposase InsO family protein